MDSTVTILVKTGFSSVRSELKKCAYRMVTSLIFFVQAEDGIRYLTVTGVQTCALPIFQRIGLAQALINEPKLVVLDEPTAGVDPAGSRAIRDLIVDFKRRGITVLLSSHLLAQDRKSVV